LIIDVEVIGGHKIYDVSNVSVMRRLWQAFVYLVKWTGFGALSVSIPYVAIRYFLYFAPQQSMA